MKKIGLVGGINWTSTGAECIILGCTEIPLLLHQRDFQVPVFDTTRIHAQAAVGFALSGNQITVQ